jgi:hypothetical protein
MPSAYTGVSQPPLTATKEKIIVSAIVIANLPFISFSPPSFFKNVYLLEPEPGAIK